MIETFSGHITNLLIETQAIKEEERRLYNYCIEGFIEIIGNIIISVILGILLGKFFETLLFLVIFIPLRSFAGGYHLKNGTVCFCTSILLFLGVIFLAGFFADNFPGFLSLKLYLVSSACIVLIAPVEAQNKKLNSQKKKKLKKYTIFFIIIISALFTIMYKISLYKYCYAISNSFFLVSLLLILGFLHNEVEKYHLGT